MVVRFPVCTLNLRKLTAYSVYADIITKRFSCKLYSKQLFSNQCVRHICQQHLVSTLFEDVGAINGRNIVYRLLPCRNFCSKHRQIKNTVDVKKPVLSVSSQFEEDIGNVEKFEDTQGDEIDSAAGPVRTKKRKLKKKKLPVLIPTKPPLNEKQERLLKLFPQPKQMVHNFYMQVASHTKKDVKKSSDLFTIKDIRMRNTMWKCKFEVEWPMKQIFEYTSTTKADAHNMACLEIISWLQSLGKIDRTGKLTIIEKKEYMNMMDKPLAEIVIGEENLQKIDDLFQQYTDMNIETIIKKNRENPPDFEVVKDVEFQSDAFRYRDDQWYITRNSKLYSNYLSRVDRDAKKTLPIMPFRETIVDEIEKNPVVVIEGETGCGKSTQVPQFILDHYIKSLRASDCNIVIAQPRRISAISLAEWVAKERGEQMGDSIGYHVRLSYILPPKKSGTIVYVTAGLLLRKLVSQPDLSDFSHVIIDEAHERSIDIDLLLYLLKKALQINPNLHVVIMSATINAKLFQSYYQGSPSVFVPGFVHPVQTFYLDTDLAVKLNFKTMPKIDDNQPNIDYNVVLRMIDWIDQNKPDGAILVFLPGWTNIKVLRDELKMNRNFFVVCAHSKLSKDEQFMIFQKPPAGIRKVVLATNIAETGITIDDVTYVVDTGIHKEERMVISGYSTLGSYWISQASVKQREGRAGRTKPGECYHLFSSEIYKTMDKYPKPEIHRAPLDKTILVCKSYTKTNEKMADFLSHLPEPPSYFAVQQAVNKLQDMNAMTANEDLTPLGKRIVLLTLDPLLSKALVYSVFFKCLNPVLTAATLLSSNLNIFPGISFDKDNIREIKKQYSPGSDHIATTWIYHHWESLRNRAEEYDYCTRNNLSRRNLATVSSLRSIHHEVLVDVKLISPDNNCFAFNNPINMYARNDDLVKAVLFSGLNNLLSIRNFHYVKGRLKVTPSFATKGGNLIHLMQDSVNSKQSKFPVPFMTYFDNHRSLERRAIIVYDTSLISPLTVLLFYGKDFMTKPSYNLPQDYIQVGIRLSSQNPINLVGNHQTLEKLCKLKTITWAIIDYLVQHTGFSENTDEFQTIIKFRDNLVKVIVTLLDEEGARIDYDKTGKL